jgi:hypothetical protein
VFLSPGAARLDLTDMALMDAIQSGKFSLRHGAATNYSHIIVRKPAVPMIQSVIVAALIRCVLVVVRNSSQPQMLWIHARRIVAAVHDNQAVRYWADKLFISPTVRRNALARFATTKGYGPITKTGLVTSPYPTSAVRFGNTVLYGNWSENLRKFGNIAVSAFGIVVRTAQVATVGFAPAKQAIRLPFHSANYTVLEN